MNQAAISRARKIRYFLGVGFGLVLLSTTLILVLVLNREDQAEETEGIQRYGNYKEKAPEDAITFEEFISRSFSAKSFNGSWWSNTELQWKDKEGNLVTWDIHTNETTILVSHDLLTMFSSGAQFKGFSPDNSLLLFAFDIQHVWRHSYTARYVVFESAANTSYDVVAKDGSEYLQYCDWVGNENEENILIYVSKNNLYWKPDAAKETAEEDVALTTDGEVDNVFNGIPDWVYEEEVLGVNYAHYINDLGTRVAYARFNDTLVPEFRYPHYGDPEDILHSQYPEYRVVRYPKAGEVNPTMSLYVRTVEEDLNKAVMPPGPVLAWGEYIYTVAGWTKEDVLSVTWMNRVQNQSVISECREGGAGWECEAIFSQDQESGWIEIAPPPTYSGEDFLQILPSKQPDSRHYKHLARVGRDTTIFLTSGYMVVTEVLAWDSSTSMVYFMGTDMLSPGSRHLYAVQDTGTQDTQCITCSIKTSRGELCQRNSVQMNFDNSYYIHTCLGQTLPESALRRVEDHSIVFLFEANLELEEKLNNKSLPKRIDTFIELEGGFQAPVKILLPPDMDEQMKHPLLVYVYGGPGSQMVTDSWSVGWGEYLVTSRRIIYASIDGRGTGFQSDEHLFQAILTIPDS
jgi:dipeptidyl-peptidase-4